MKKQISIAVAFFDATAYRLFWALCVLMIVFAALYMYAISASIVHVVLREEIALDIAKTHSNIGVSEAKYLALQNTINEALAIEKGFIALPNKQFARRTDTANVTFNR